jgi:hypothetical protein
MNAFTFSGFNYSNDALGTASANVQRDEIASEAANANTDASTNTDSSEQTVESPGIQEILAAASACARPAGLDRVSMNALIWALVRFQSTELESLGIRDVHVLDGKLGSVMFQHPARAKPDTEAPKIDNSVLSILSHAQGIAFAKDRSQCGIVDLMQAISQAIKSGQLQSEAALLLRDHWPDLQRGDALADIMERLIELQTRQIPNLSEAVARLTDDVASRFEANERLIATLASDMDGIKPKVTVPQTPPPRSSVFMKRLLGLQTQTA